MSIETGISTRPGKELSGPQQVALSALTGGSSFPEAAAAAGVSRATVYRWAQSDPIFRAAYDAWEQASLQSTRAQLLIALGPAVQRLVRSVEVDGRFAFKVIKELGGFRRPRPPVPEVDQVPKVIGAETQEPEQVQDPRRDRPAKTPDPASAEREAGKGDAPAAEAEQQRLAAIGDLTLMLGMASAKVTDGDEEPAGVQAAATQEAESANTARSDGNTTLLSSEVKQHRRPTESSSTDEVLIDLVGPANATNFATVASDDFSHIVTSNLK